MVDIPLGGLVPAALVFVAVALGSVAIVLFLEGLGEQRRRGQFLSRLSKLTAGDDEAAGLFRRAGKEPPPWLQNLIDRTPAIADLQLMLQQGGLTWRVDSFILLTLGSGAAFGLAALTLTRVPFAALIAAGLGGAGPYLYVRRKRNQRLGRFEALLPEAIDLLGRAIRAGHPLASGLKMVASETQEPVASEFQRTFEEQRFGLPFEDAMLAMADRITLIDLRILVTAILIQREVGGNLAEVLDNLASVIRARFTIRRQLRTYTAQGRISGYVLAVLPIAVGTAIYFLNPEYIGLLFAEPLGRFMLITAVIMQIMGYLWIRKIVNIDL